MSDICEGCTYKKQVEAIEKVFDTEYRRKVNVQFQMLRDISDILYKKFRRKEVTEKIK
jgi:hypothetical protein